MIFVDEVLYKLRIKADLVFVWAYPAVPSPFSSRPGFEFRYSFLYFIVRLSVLNDYGGGELTSPPPTSSRSKPAQKAAPHRGIGLWIASTY
jgi:hypothetical protein